MRGIAIRKDGTYGKGLDWCVYAIGEDGAKTLLSPTRVLDVLEPQVVVVERLNKQTKKMEKVKRHMDIKVGTRIATGERQDAALVRAMQELKAQVTAQNGVRGVLLPAVGP